MVTSHTLTGDLSDLVGTDFPRGSVWVTIRTNLGDADVRDSTGKQIRLPRHRFALAADGTFSKSLWSTAALTTPTGYQYQVEVEWPDGPGGTAKKKWTSGWFSLTASIDLSEVAYDPYIPPEYYPELKIARDEAVAAAAAAAASEAGVAADAATATTKAGEAAASATAAATSATTATTKASEADAAATAAAASESTATTKAGEAAASASAAATDAAAADTSATNAAASATAAQTAETAAETAQAGAETARTGAEAAQAAAEAVGNTNDTIIAGRINDPASATASALSASTDLRIAAADLAPGYTGVRPPVANRSFNPPRLMLATFQPGHGWGQASTSSFNVNDTTDYVMGSQSAYIVTQGNGSQSLLSKTAAVTSLDMTGRVFALLCKITNLAYLNRLTLIAGSNTFADNYQFQVQASATLTDQEITPEGRWVWVTLPWNPSTTAGAPSRSAITDLRVVAVDNNTGQQVKVQVQAIAAQKERPPAFPNGVVSLGFDDNWISQKTYGTSYMDRYGFPGTIYTIVDLIDTPGRHTLDDLKRVEEYSGGEVAAHSWTLDTHNLGFTNLDPETLDTELRLMKEWLTSHGFQGRDFLAYPLGYLDGTVMDIAARYYRFARTVNSRQDETLPPGNAFTCRAQSNLNTTSGLGVTQAIDRTIARGSWLNLLWHDIVDTTSTPAGSVQVKRSDFELVIDHLNTTGVPVRTVSQVLRACSDSNVLPA